MIVSLAVPAVLENLLSTAVFFADTLLIGWMKDPASLAAVGLSGTYLFIAQGVVMALGIGALAVVARAWGAGDFAAARRAAGQSVSLTFVFTLLMVPLMILLARPFFSLLVQDPNAQMRETVIGLASEYATIIMLGSLLAYPRFVLSMVMRAAGDTRTPMYITLLVNVLNIALAAALIFGIGPIPSMGVRGAGIATAIAQAIGGLLSFGAVLTGISQPKLTLREMFIWDKREVSRIWRLALPNIIESAIQRVGFVTFMGIVSSLGAAAIAAHQITNSIESMSFMPGSGLATAVSTIVGQALGAGDMRTAEIGTRRSVIFGILLMSSIGAAFVAFGTQLSGIFGATQEVLSLAANTVRISALELPTLAIYMIYSSALRGAGDMRSPMIVSLIGAVFFRVAAVWFFAVQLKLGLNGVWLGTAIDWLGRAVIIYALYRRGRWKSLVV
ncbi:MAG: MATE family efflux transporter [Chloroflexi bacterium]|nr:MATE family efflux transporter [Chloroflexota bacterium]